MTNPNNLPRIPITESTELDGIVYTANTHYGPSCSNKRVEFAADGQPAGHGILCWQTLSTRERRQSTTTLPDEALDALEEQLLTAMGRYQNANR